MKIKSKFINIIKDVIIIKNENNSKGVYLEGLIFRKTKSKPYKYCKKICINYSCVPELRDGEH